MALLDIIVLAIIQGITEFLPISSSGHLVLWPLLTGRPDQGARMDVAVHFGTLIAVCLYFRAETRGLFAGTRDILIGRWRTPAARLAWLVGIASVPAVAAGLAIKLADVQDAMRTIAVIGWTTLVGGILLWAADRWGPTHRRAASAGAGDGATADVPGWRLSDALAMGLAQTLALVPGTSRSGITMTAARALGFQREEAARLSLVMAIPLILAATAVETAGALAGGELTGAEGAQGLAAVTDLALGALLSCLAALAALWTMMRMFAERWTMTPFVIYRVGLGLALLGTAYL
ncbi:MAG: undecaprenyl-diphosphate phosphatase [Pseudomonadota bacterium]